MVTKISLKRFFKRFSLFDYLIVIILIIALLLVYKFLHHKQKIIQVRAITYATAFQLNSLHKDDYEKDPFGKKIAVVKSFEADDLPGMDTNQPFNKIVTIDLSMQVDIQGTTFQYKNAPLQVGSQINLIFNSVSIYAFISEIEGISSQRESVEKILTIRLYGVYPWVADNIREGEIYLGINHKEKARVVSKRVTPAQVTNVNSNGESVLSVDPRRADLTFQIKAPLQKVGNSFIFQGFNNIYKGKTISFIMDNTQINDGLITDIQ